MPTPVFDPAQPYTEEGQPPAFDPEQNFQVDRKATGIALRAEKDRVAADNRNVWNAAWWLSDLASNDIAAAKRVPAAILNAPSALNNLLLPENLRSPPPFQPGQPIISAEAITPQYVGPRLPDKVEQTMKGLLEAGGEFASGLTTPENIVAAPLLATPAAPAVAAGFATQAAAAVPEAAQQFGSAMGSDVPLSEKVRTGAGLAANIALPVAIAGGPVIGEAARNLREATRDRVLDRIEARNFQAASDELALQRATRASVPKFQPDKPFTEEAASASPTSLPSRETIFPPLATEASAPENSTLSPQLSTAPTPEQRPAAETLPSPEQAAILPSGETITGPDVRTGTGMPAEPGVAQAAPGPLPKSILRRPTENRPWDVIDEYQGQVGGKISLAKAQQLIEDFKPIGAARKLFTRQGGYSPDVAAQGVSGFKSYDSDVAFLESLNEAAQARKGARAQASTEKTALKEQEAQRIDFERNAFKPNAPGKPKSEPINVNELLIGDEFKLAGAKVKVKDLVFDPDTADLAYVVLEDGNRFEVQTVGADQVIHPDKGSIKQTGPNTQFVPPEAPATAPKLRPMEQGTGALFQGADQPFNLAGETATDFERIAAEKAKAEQTRQEAAVIASRQQQELLPGRVSASGTSAPRPLRAPVAKVAPPAEIASTPIKPVGPIRQYFAERVLGFKKVFAPQSIDAPARNVANVMREMLGRSAIALVRADDAMHEWRKEFDRTPVRNDYAYDPAAPLPHNYAVIDALERNRAALPERYQALAKTFDDEFKWRIAEIQKFAPNALQHLIENYFPHIWKDEAKASSVMGQIANRLFAGRKEFLKQRSLAVFTEGLERGLKPISDNPVDLLLAKMHSMDKFIASLREQAEFKASGHMKFTYIFERPPEGWSALDDPAFIVHKPPFVTVKEAYDAQMRTKTEELLRKLGVPESRLASLGGKRWGLAYESPEQIKTRFGGPMSIYWHELGHVLDNRYDLQNNFLKQSTEFNGQLRALADARIGEGQSKSFKKYVRSGPEKMAVMLEAYVHAPDKFRSLAPEVFDRFTRFIEEHPELHEIDSIKPSLRLGVGESKVPVGGLVTLGKWYMPDGAAQVIRNYLSPGLARYGAYRTFRAASNLLNGAQLGLSAFHVGFTSLDAVVNSVELGLYQLAHGRPIESAKMFGKAPFAPITNPFTGKAIQTAMIRPNARSFSVLGMGKFQITDLHRQIADMAVKAGLRATVDPFWQTGFTRRLQRAVRAGGLAWLKTPLQAPFALMEQIQRPIMEYLVPWQKLGVFAELARSEMARAGLNATPDQVRAGLARAADATEDRMGQMTYDNLFYSHIAKDLALLGFRAFGWQLGKYRHLVGAASDTAQAVKMLATGQMPEATHRMLYFVALPMTVAAVGATLHYLLTGRRPDSAMDYFHPSTGMLDRNGKEQRLSLPSYLKDLESDAIGIRRGFASGGPLGAGRGLFDATYHRANPWIAEVVDMLNNKDFYGTQIYNPDDPLMSKMADQAKFIAQQGTPFAVTGAKRLAEEDSPLLKIALPFIGIVPAKRELTMTPAEAKSAEIIQNSFEVGGRTKEQFERSQLAKQIIREMGQNPMAGQEHLVQAMSGGQISPDRARAIASAATLTPLQWQVKKMTADDAMRVWDLANADERAQIGTLIYFKIVNAKSIDLPKKQHYMQQLQKPK